MSPLQGGSVPACRRGSAPPVSRSERPTGCDGVMANVLDSGNDERRELDMRMVWRTLWRHKAIVAVSAVVLAVVAAVLALRATPIFRAQATVTEVRENAIGGASSLANQLGGLASLAGVSLGVSGQDREHEAILVSQHLAEEFVKRNNVTSLMYAGRDGPPRSEWRAVQDFRKNMLTITEDKLKGTTTIAIDWPDPVVAARWANGYVALANELIRSRALEDAGRNIDFLNKQIVKTNVVEVQRVMYNLIEQETKTLMLANARAEYAFTVVDPAVPPEQRISPKRTLMVLTGGVLGVLCGALLALAYDKWRASRVGVRQLA